MTRRRRLTLVAMCIAQGMTLLDVTIVNTALPSIQRELHMTAGQLEWVISAYALSLAAFIPLGGALGDRFGRKRFFLVGMVVFTLGSVACALSTSDVALIGSRALQGAGGAFMSALTLAILTETYPVERRAGAFGMWAAISGLGFGLGPVVGGALLSVFSWSSVFWVNVPFAVAGFVIAYVAVTESRSPEGRAARRRRDDRHRARSPGHHLRPDRVIQSSLGITRRRRPVGGWRGPGGVLRLLGEPHVVTDAPSEIVAGAQLRLRVRRLSADVPRPGRGHVLRHAALPGCRGLVTIADRVVMAVDEYPVHHHRTIRRQVQTPLSAGRDRGQRVPGRRVGRGHPCLAVGHHVVRRCVRRLRVRGDRLGNAGARCGQRRHARRPSRRRGRRVGTGQRSPAGRNLGGSGGPRDLRGPCRHDCLGHPHRRRAGRRRTGAVCRRWADQHGDPRPRCAVPARCGGRLRVGVPPGVDHRYRRDACRGRGGCRGAAFWRGSCRSRAGGRRPANRRGRRVATLRHAGSVNPAV